MASASFSGAGKRRAGYGSRIVSVVRRPPFRDMSLALAIEAGLDRARQLADDDETVTLSPMRERGPPTQK